MGGINIDLQGVARIGYGEITADRLAEKGKRCRPTRLDTGYGYF